MKLLDITPAAGLLAVFMVTAGQLAAAVPTAAVPYELLDAEQAFQASARFLDADTIELQYDIADGYYMYRERFKFSTEDGLPALGTARTPRGKVKQDATFGRVETYRHSVRVVLPLRDAGKAGKDDSTLKRRPFVALQVTSQGCADAGVCYPPQRHNFKLERGSLVAVRALSATSASFSSAGGREAPAQSSTSASKISDLIKRIR